MTYQILILPRAHKQLTKLPKQNYARIRDLIADLGANPRPSNCKKLTAREGWRIRSGDYRVIYEIDDRTQVVIVLDIGHRKDIYS